MSTIALKTLSLTLIRIKSIFDHSYMIIISKVGLTMIRRRNYKQDSEKWKQNLVVVVCKVIFVSNPTLIRLSWVESGV